MTLSSLMNLIPPPAEPVYTGTRAEWDAIQDNMKIVFPKEYYEVCYVYGSGHFSGEFLIANLFDPEARDYGFAELTRFDEARERDPHEVPYPLYPEAGGIFPFGMDGNGNTFAWLTKGRPNQWPIVCFNSEDYSEITRHSLTEFIALLIANSLEINRSKFWGPGSKYSMIFVPKQIARKKGRKGKRK